MKRFLLILGLVIWYSVSCTAQNDSLEIMEEKAGIFLANENYLEAQKIYENLVGKQPNNPDYNFKLGFCYLQSDQTVFNSILYFEKAEDIYSINENVEQMNMVIFYKAQANHKSYQFDSAIEIYKGLIEKTTNKQLKKQAEKELEIVETAGQFFSQAHFFRLTKYGILNSEYDDHSPVISADESVIIFTSKRPGNTGDLRTETGEPFEDIYIFRKGVHKRPVNIGSPINTESHDATCGLSADGNELFIYRATRQDKGDIYHSVFDGTNWSNPKRLGPNINTKYRETHASLSSEGSLLYICSNRKGGYGGFDIYVSEKQPDGTWGPVKNLGPTINTDEDEIGPYIHPNGKSLYFSSKGHPGMGGFDIFTSEMEENGEWNEPQNIGFPLNTVEHDVFFVPGGDGKSGYYSSEKDGSVNIYKANFPDREEKNISLFTGYVSTNFVYRRNIEAEKCVSENEQFSDPNGNSYPALYSYSKKNRAFIMAEKQGSNIVFKDSTHFIPKKAQVYILDIETGDTVRQVSVSDYNGRFMFIMKEQKDYKMIFTADDYIYDTHDIHGEDQVGYFKLNYNAHLDSVSSENIKATRKIGFENGLTSLSEFAEVEVKLLTNFLQEHPDLFVSVSGCDYLVYDSNPDFRRLECEYAESRKRKFIKKLEEAGIDKERITSDLFAVSQYGDTLSYTIYNKNQAVKEVKVKEERTKTFDVVKTEATLTDNEIAEKYGTVSVGKNIIIVNNMQFKINRYSATGYNENLKQLATFLIENPSAEIMLSGYTDSQGDKDYNYKLSNKRSAFVRNELVRMGVDSMQIYTEGKGFEKPIAFNKKKDGSFYWQALPYNRRVEIKLVKEGLSHELFVREINVPKKYVYSSDVNNIQKGKEIYAIGLKVVDKKEPLSNFDNLTEGISEKQYSDGTFLYFFGKYESRETVLDEYHKIKADYPDAFIFLR